jgi:hypothetical protein
MENIGSLVIPVILALVGIGIFFAPTEFMLSWDKRTGYHIYKSVLESTNNEEKAIRAAGIFYKIFGAIFFIFSSIFIFIALLNI